MTPVPCILWVEKKKIPHWKKSYIWDHLDWYSGALESVLFFLGLTWSYDANFTWFLTNFDSCITNNSTDICGVFKSHDVANCSFWELNTQDAITMYCTILWKCKNITEYYMYYKHNQEKKEFFLSNPKKNFQLLNYCDSLTVWVVVERARGGGGGEGGGKGGRENSKNFWSGVCGWIFE